MFMTIDIQHSGLTVIELIAAVAVAGILGGTAVSSYHSMLADWRLNAAARQLIVDLQRARAQAVAENAGHRLQFTLPAQSYARQREADPSVYEPLGNPTALPEGVEVVGCTARGAAVGFAPRGHASTFGTITLRGASGREHRVIVDIAGRARIE